MYFWQCAESMFLCADHQQCADNDRDRCSLASSRDSSQPFSRHVEVTGRWLAAGQMKDLVTTGLGLIMFGDVQYNAKNILGVTMGMLGAMLYSFLSYWERNNVRSQ